MLVSSQELIALGGFSATIFLTQLYFNKAKSPEKSWAIALLNTILGPLHGLGLPPYHHGDLTIENVMRLVEESTKLNDYENMRFVELYHSICDLPDFKNQRFSHLGYLIALTELQLNLTRKLRTVDCFKRHPQIEQVPIRAPIFVFGLGRSGTTFLHRLLSLDPNSRSPLLWELLEPVPGPGVSFDSPANVMDADRERRMLAIKKVCMDRNVMGDDGLEKFHEIGYDLPEECFFSLSTELPLVGHYLFFLLTNWNEFRRTATTEDLVRAYRWHKRTLQLLSHQTDGLENGKRWVLKCPLHTFLIPELVRVFPDCKLVWAHRHPVRSVPSLCSLMLALRGLYFDNSTLDTKECGQRIYSLFSQLVTDAPRFIEESNRPCSHVLFENLTADPVGTVKEVYKQLDLPFTSEYEEIIKAYLESNKMQRKEVLKRLSKAAGKEVTALHEHRPEDFGLTHAALSGGAFGDYIHKYNINSTK